MAKKILVVDDEKDLVLTLTCRLEALGYKVIVAHDGEEALNKARSEKPSLILMDIMMPKLNGYQACRELKNNEETRSIPVIMLTVKGQETDKFWGEEVGADDYIVKPFEASELARRIGSFLG